MDCLGDRAHDAGAAAEVQDLANLEVSAAGVDAWVGSDERRDLHVVGLGNGGAELASGDGVLTTAGGRRRSFLAWSRRGSRSRGWSTSASSATFAHRGRGGRAVVGLVALDLLAWVGEFDILAPLRRASIADVGDEHVWAVVEGRGAAARDGNVGAVHVHLPVTSLVEPRPCPDGIAGLGFGGDGEAVFLVLVEDVSTGRADAVADERLDDLPSLALVVRERDLARTTVVGSLQALSFEGYRLACGIGL